MKLNKLFKIHYGQKQFHNKETLDEGDSLLVSSQATDNGCYGFFEIESKYETPIITVPSTGSIGEAFVQIYPCSVDDNCLVLEPLAQYVKEYLFYIAFKIRTQKWRYRYGRQITPYRLGKLEVDTPADSNIDIFYDRLSIELYPVKHFHIYNGKNISTKIFKIDEIFVPQRGHFHAIDRLEQGNYPTISRVSGDNGVVGFYAKPTKAKVFPKGTITVSTVTGDAFLQQTPFIATDNVVICIPIIQLRVSTLLYIVALLNKIKWRYSYGRQCYKNNFLKTVLNLPVLKDDNIDEDYIEEFVTTLPYWHEYKTKLLG
ncbi:MAG: restriction endonuclease subunit S [Dehalococcoidales bacterium]